MLFGFPAMRVDNSAQYQQTGDLPAVTLSHPDNTHHTADMNDGEAASATDKVSRVCQLPNVIPNLMNRKISLAKFIKC